MAEYNKQKIDRWLDGLPEDSVALNAIQLAVTTPEIAGSLAAYFDMSSWEKTNALFGLARRTEGHVRACAQAMALVARDEDRGDRE